MDLKDLEQGRRGRALERIESESRGQTETTRQWAEDEGTRGNRSELRQRAEQKLERTSPEGVLEENAERTLHELRVHQVELEMQNEELRHAQAQLEESQRRYFDLYDLAPVGFCSLNETGVIEIANLAVETMLGLARGEANHRRFSQFIHRDDQDAYNLHHQRVSETGETQTFELRMLRPDAAPIWVRLTLAAARNETEEPGYRIALSDIGAEKRAEDEQRLLQERLQQSQKMESVVQLAGGIAHDFNNKLLIILGHTELALQSVGPDEALHEGLREIQKAAQCSAELTNQLLAFAHRQMVLPKVLDLGDAVESKLKMLRQLVGEDIELAWQPAAGLWPVLVDPGQIDQLLTNLCMNARDAIDGAGRITIEAENCEADASRGSEHPGSETGSYVRLSVTDTGCGIGKEIQAHIFEPFFTTKAIGEGTGLGLSTVYGIVQQNKGYLEVESERREGTKIHVYLPRHQGGATAPCSPTAPSLPGGQETILLVDDEAAILQMASLWLGKQGYTVLSTTTPREAIRLADQHPDPISLLITDVMMPEMNGHDLSREIFSLNPRMKCLFMSGYTADVIADHGVVEAGLDFLQKPFSLKNLAEKVRQVLDRGPAGEGV